MYNVTKPYRYKIKELIQSTWDTPWVSIQDGVYSLITKKFDYPEVDHTDGIGTKGEYHWQHKTIKNAVIDALAMNLNDLILMGAVPYKLQNHIIIPEDDHKAIEEIVSCLVEECRKRDIAITGGETSIHNNTTALDLSITISGFVREVRFNQFQEGDVLIGIASSGLHSNGFSKVRAVFGDVFYPELTEPTRIYSDELLPLLSKYQINGMMHITGGAFTKLKDLLPGLNAVITKNHRLLPQKIFHKLYASGISDEEMYSTFNCGIGFVLSTPKEYAQVLTGLIKDSDIIGMITKGESGVIIQSAFSEKQVEL